MRCFANRTPDGAILVYREKSDPQVLFNAIFQEFCGVWVYTEKFQA